MKCKAVYAANKRKIPDSQEFFENSREIQLLDLDLGAFSFHFSLLISISRHFHFTSHSQSQGICISLFILEMSGSDFHFRFRFSNKKCKRLFLTFASRTFNINSRRTLPSHAHIPTWHICMYPNPHISHILLINHHIFIIYPHIPSPHTTHLALPALDWGCRGCVEPQVNPGWSTHFLQPTFNGGQVGVKSINQSKSPGWSCHQVPTVKSINQSKCHLMSEIDQSIKVNIT